MTPLNSRTVDVERGNGALDQNEHQFQNLKVSIHEELVESLELSMLAQVNEHDLWDEVLEVADKMCREHARTLDDVARQRMFNELMDEVFGLGPLEALMKDSEISDILVNHQHEVFVERRGRLELTDVIFADQQHLMRIIQRVVSRVGRRIDESTPMVDARLPDGSRINAIVPPLALNGPTLSIRRFGADPLQIDDLIANNSTTSEMADFLAGAVDARVSFLIAGGTGAGKTTLLNAMTTFISYDERLISIEDSAELLLQHKHVVRLETRVANTESTGEITQRDLVRNSLRMRPDRIIVGEVRGAEALDMLQAMNTGHEGSLTTIHANDTRDALSRLEIMVAMSGFELPLPVVREYIAGGIGIVVYLSRLKGGERKVMRISEIVGIKNGNYHLEDIFGFEQTGVDEDGVAQGEFYTTGYRPQCLAQIKAAGIHVPDSIFRESR